MSKQVKSYCNSDECLFKPVTFNTFEYMYCSVCKCEVEDDLVEYKARRKAYKESANINPHMKKQDGDDADDTQGDLFDVWSGV